MTISVKEEVVLECMGNNTRDRLKLINILIGIIVIFTEKLVIEINDNIDNIDVIKFNVFLYWLNIYPYYFKVGYDNIRFVYKRD